MEARGIVRVRRPPAYDVDWHPLRARTPHVTLLSLNVLGKDSPSIPSVASAAQAQECMEDLGREYVISAPARAAFGTLLTDIADSSGAQLYHCSAGKDRTGWATAVILTLLGVPAKTVMSDYLLSNAYYFDSAALQGQLSALPAAKSAVYTHLLGVEPALRVLRPVGAVAVAADVEQRGGEGGRPDAL